ncbi:hypothetical protein Leryth_022631 [Lithospermum erythrorhizon]|nr:hypothetical protein Leryth_022631 [Lithospermum erythrorhizon]
MAPFSKEVVNLKLLPLIILWLLLSVKVEAGTWCVARSDASDAALQLALDYACASGADCTPIQKSGLCFLPNTLPAHASYAFNSYFQRRAMAPGSCNFAGTATIAKTDPSYGSCVYPSSTSSAGGTVSSGGGSTTIPTPTPTPTPPPSSLYPPGGQIPDTADSIAPRFSILNTLLTVLLLIVDAFKLM